MISRRKVLQGIGTFAIAGTGLGGYALGVEPWRLGVTRYRLSPPRWPAGLSLRLAVIADTHVCEPWMGLSRVETIVERTNALGVDAIMLLGDYTSGSRMPHRNVPDLEWARILSQLKAPHGVHAVLGNHDWWNDREVQRRMAGPPQCRIAMEAAGLHVYENDAIRLVKNDQPFWVAGLGDQWAFYRNPERKRGERFGFRGVDDLAGTLAKVTDNAPVILMAHEPDIFPRVPDRVSLTLSGHTHGGQIQFFGYAPIVPSRYGRRFVYGHIIEENRHLVVSGGLGCSGIPMRFGRPPEIVVVDITA